MVNFANTKQNFREKFAFETRCDHNFGNTKHQNFWKILHSKHFVSTQQITRITEIDVHNVYSEISRHFFRDFTRNSK
jgi:hypothetical protein